MDYQQTYHMEPSMYPGNGYIQHAPMPYSLYAQPRTMYQSRRAMEYGQELRRPMLAHMDKNETTKARLAKDQVDILEAKFQENQKPNSQTKRLLANDFGVEVARINNWFQNRRAKAKQERKQAENDRQNLDDDDSSSEDNYTGDINGDETYGMPIAMGPASSLDHSIVGSYESLIAVPNDFLDVSPYAYNEPSNTAFPTTTGVNGLGFMMAPETTQRMVCNDPWTQLEQIAQQQAAFASDETSMPSQFQAPSMIPTSVSGPVEQDIAQQNMLRAIHYPHATDIASRRRKARPANLGIEAVRSSLGPRSYSSSDVSARPAPSSATTTPMRRVVSNGLNVLSGRVQKKSSMQQLRSPVRNHFGEHTQTYYPPTPSSSYDHSMHRSTSSSTSAPESEYNCVPTGNMMASPPETPYNPVVGSHWSLELPEQALHSSTAEYFPQEMLYGFEGLPSQIPFGNTSMSVPSTPYGVMPGVFPMSSPQLAAGFEHEAFRWHMPTTHSLGSSPVSAHPKSFVFNNQTQETVKRHQKR